MLEWPGRCRQCGENIDNWSESGLYEGRWIHKACYTVEWNRARAEGAELMELRPPEERGTQLELPMLISLLLFHFGLGFAVIGWIMLDQDESAATASLLLVIGVVTPLLGLAGIALNIISRKRIETIRQAVETAGGWKPGR